MIYSWIFKDFKEVYMLISAIYNMEELNKLNNLIDGAILNTKNYSLIIQQLL